MPPETPKIRVLLVDDEVDFRETLCKILKRRGMEVRVAGSGSEALACLASETHDVVVLDLKMPGMDGLETLNRMASDHSSVPVIMLTGHGTVAAALEAIRHQVFDFLLKPVPIDQLVGAIEAATHDRRGGT
jgi:DNA-binding NtrC family response regulator